MAIIRQLHNAVHFREFQNDPVTGHRYHATCGETALSSAMVNAMTAIESSDQAISLMESMTREMMGLHWADSPEGATTTRHLHDEAIRRGFVVDEAHYIAWEDPIPDSVLHPLLLEYAGIKPIVLMITNAGPALNAIDGSHDERGVHGHFIEIDGLANEGYLAMDGDNDMIAYHQVIYPWASIEQAHVTGFLMLEPQHGVPQHMPLPTNWTDDGAALHNPENANVVVKGFREMILAAASWDSDNVPEDDEHIVTGDLELSNPSFGKDAKTKVQQTFTKDLYAAIEDQTGKWSISREYVGRELLAARARIAALEAQLASIKPDPIAEQCKAAIVALVEAMKAA